MDATIKMKNGEFSVINGCRGFSMCQQYRMLGDRVDLDSEPTATLKCFGSSIEYSAPIENVASIFDETGKKIYDSKLAETGFYRFLTAKTEKERTQACNDALGIFNLNADGTPIGKREEEPRPMDDCEKKTGFFTGHMDVSGFYHDDF